MLSKSLFILAALSGAFGISCNFGAGPTIQSFDGAYDYCVVEVVCYDPKIRRQGRTEISCADPNAVYRYNFHGFRINNNAEENDSTPEIACQYKYMMEHKEGGDTLYTHKCCFTEDCNTLQFGVDRKDEFVASLGGLSKDTSNVSSTNNIDPTDIPTEPTILTPTITSVVGNSNTIQYYNTMATSAPIIGSPTRAATTTYINAKSGIVANSVGVLSMVSLVLSFI